MSHIILFCVVVAVVVATGLLLKGQQQPAAESTMDKLFGSVRGSLATTTYPNSGWRVHEPTQLEVHWYDQTVAILELSADRQLLACKFTGMR